MKYKKIVQTTHMVEYSLLFSRVDCWWAWQPKRLSWGKRTLEMPDVYQQL